ncbi:MAG TPA: hypothetical protein VJ650_02135 [Gemmatimonadaceae bacterium]|nr:hypothetical protein [Gemmatimonadaceae bacterium]
MTLRFAYAALFLAGLVLGVIAMLVGIQKDSPPRTARSLFNLATVGAFVTVIGAVGYPLARYTSLGALAVTAIAVAAGLAGWGLAVAMIAGWAVPSAARETEDERYALQGFVGKVTQPIGTGTPGEISYQVEGAWHRARARSLDGQPIESGTEIAIERIEEGIAWVERWSTIERQLELP